MFCIALNVYGDKSVKKISSIKKKKKQGMWGELTLTISVRHSMSIEFLPQSPNNHVTFYRSNFPRYHLNWTGITERSVSLVMLVIFHFMPF